jgi:hypothetical protein
LKLRCKELEVMALTYTPDANKALDMIRQEFAEAIDKANKDISRLRGELQRYEAVGPTFDNLVTKYSKVQKDIVGKEWALKELTNSAT